MSIPIETVKTDNLTMRFFRFGHGPKTCVILPGLSVKSVMDSADTVAKQYAVFDDDFTTYLFDRRLDLPTTSGADDVHPACDDSSSGASAPRYTIADMARDTAEAILSLGLSDLHLFGASQGGMIALALTIENPGLVSKLALGSTTARVPSEDSVSSDASLSDSSADAADLSADSARDSITGWIDLAKAGDAVTLYREFGRKLYPAALFEQYKSVLEGLGNFVTADDLRRFVTIAEGTAGFDVTPSLSSITCPVLVLGSEDDQVIAPDCSREIAAGLTGAASCELHMYDGYGHAAFDTAPDYQQRLLEFFRR